MNITNKNKKLESWNSSIDLIRIFALLLVNSIHFFLWSEFYALPIEGLMPFIFINIRILSMSSVPLFLIITGYLMNKKNFCLKHYRGLIRIFILYTLCGLICLTFQTLFNNYIPELGTYSGFRQTISLLLSFNLVPYGWYVAMYLGLFCLIPLLNLIYNNLKSKKQKIWLCAIFIILTSLPSLLNNFNFFQNSLFHAIFNNTGQYTIILTDSWKAVYPLTYYFIGCYLREYPIKINKVINSILIVLVLFSFSVYSYISFDGSTYNIGELHQWWSFTTLILSILIFNLFTSFKLLNINIKLKLLIKKLASYVFCAYMLSYIFDIIVYSYLKSNVLVLSDRLWYYPICIFVVFISSLALSSIVNLFYGTIIKTIAIAKNHYNRA